MKKGVFGLALLLITGVNILFAQTTWTTNGVYSGSQNISASLGFAGVGSITGGRLPVSLLYHFEIPRVSATAGFQYNNDNTNFDWDTSDIALNGIYFLPFNWKHVRLGVGGVYHAGFLKETSVQNDILLGAYSTFTFSYFYVNLNASWYENILTIYSLPKEYQTFAQSDLAVSIFIGAKLLDNFTAEIGVSSYEMYRYNLFLNPSFSVSLRYQFNRPFFEGKPMDGRIFAGLSTLARYSDMFTLSGHIVNTLTTITVGYTF
ncbi:hypothetical protein FACS1894137_08020 [Spirochaetia bacterium]|nr:hypothetical protein FACS1894137_08020 [Spirochaetia bacterium]